MEKNLNRLYAEAAVFAFEAHTGHFRKESRSEYYNHLVRVSESIQEHFPTHRNIKLIRISALLHDTIEDTWVTKDFISKKFGEKIASIVDEVSKKKNPDRKKQEEDFISQVSVASDEAKIIKLLDIKDNVEDMDDCKLWKSFFLSSGEMLNKMELKDSTHKASFNAIKKNILKDIDKKLVLSGR